MDGLGILEVAYLPASCSEDLTFSARELMLQLVQDLIRRLGIRRVSIGTRDPSSGWWSRAIKTTLYEIQEACNDTFRNSYRDAAERALQTARAKGLTQIVELGAGTAPIAQQLAARNDLGEIRLTICDLLPNEEHFRELTRRFPSSIEPIYESVDFGIPRIWPEKTMLLLVCTFPAIEMPDRPRVLASLTHSAACVMVYEASRNSLLSRAINCLALFPGWLLPLTRIRTPGFWRRVVCCWLVPVAPWLFVWDGLWWSYRCWRDGQWRTHLQQVAPGRSLKICSTGNTQLVTW